MIQLLVNLAESLEEYSVFSEIKNTRLGLFLIHANQFNQEAQSTQDIELYKKKFLSENYANYKELCDYDVFSIIRSLAYLESNHPAVQIAKRIHYRQLPKIIWIDPVNADIVQNKITAFKNEHTKTIQPWEIELIQTPQHRSYIVEEDPIFIVNEHGTLRPLNEMSYMVDAMGNQFERIAFICIDKGCYEKPPVQRFIKNLG